MEKIWEYKVDAGIAAKRGLLLFRDNKKDKSGRLLFTDNRKYLFSINTNGKPSSGFGNNGKN